MNPCSRSHRHPSAVKNRPTYHLLTALATLPISLLLSPLASGATLYWDGNSTGASGNPPTSGVGGNGTWHASTGAKWWNGTAYQDWNATGGQDIADFRGSAGTVTVSATVAVNRINQAVNSYTFNSVNSGSGTINFGSTGIWEFNNTQTTTINAMLSGDLTLNATGSTLTLSTSASAIITGNNTGLSSLDVALSTDTNHVIAVGANSLGGASTTSTLSKGVVNLGNNSNVNATLALGTLDLAGGTMRARFGVYTLNSATSLSADSLLISRNSAGVGLVFSPTSTINLNDKTLNILSSGNSSGVVINGVISGSGNLTTLASSTISSGDNGAGLITLGANNEYTGVTTINSGTFVVASSGSINSSSSVVINGGKFRYDNTSTSLAAPTTLNSGTLTGTGSVTLGAVTVANNSSAILTNNDGATGAGMTVGNLTFDGAATLNLKLDVADTSAILAANALTTNAAGLVTINPATNTGLWSTGSTYNLVTYTGGSIGGAGFGQFSLGPISGLTARQNTTFGNSGSAITLTINGDNPFWIGGSNGDWNTSQTGNWRLVGGNTETAFLQGDEVHFTDAATGTTNVNITENVTTTAVLFDNTTQDYTIGSTGGFGITSAVSVTKNGTGTVTLGSNNIYSGSTTINSGTLRVQGGAAIGDTNVVTVADAASATLDVQTSETIGALSGGGSSGGTVSIASGQTLTLGGVSAQSYAGAIIGSGALNLSGSANQSFTAGANINVALTGTGTLSVTGSGTVALGAANTFGGRVNLANTAGATLDMTAANQTFGSLSGGGSTGGTVAMSTRNVTLTAASNQTYNGVFTGSGDIIINAGNPSATVSFGGDNTGKSTAFTGNVRVQNGTFILGKTGDILGTNSAGLGTQAIIVSSGATARLAYGNAAYNQNQNFVLNGTGSDGNGALQALAMNFGNGAIGGIVTAGDSLVRVTRDNSDSATRTLLVRNSLAGSGNLTFDGGTGTKRGFVQLNVSSGELTLGGTTYGAFSGNLSLINDLTMIANAANALGNVNTVDVATGSTLTFNSVASQTIGGLQGAGTINVNGSTLTLGAGNATASFSGVVQNTSGNGSLIKTGSGTQTLTAANTFSGATTINAGSLVIGAGGSIANTSGISVAGGATFTNNSATGITKALTVSEGATINGTGSVTASGMSFAANLADGVSSVSLGAAFSKGGDLTLNFTNVQAGSFTLFSGASIGGSFSNVFVGSNALAQSGSVFSALIDTFNYSYDDSTQVMTVSAIPEPATFAALAGLLGLGMAATRRRRVSA